MTDTAPAPSAPEVEEGVDFRRSGFAEPYDLVVDGTAVPFVSGHKFVGGNDEHPVEGEFVSFVVDHRFVTDIPAEYADKVARLLADAIAVASGYTCHPRHGDIPLPLTPYHGTAKLGEKLSDVEALPFHNGLLDLPSCEG